MTARPGRGGVGVTVAIVMAALALVAPARADTLTVGVFAPAAPLPGTPARLELAGQLATHLARAIDADGVGRVYARASDFAAAAGRGEVQLAVVDPSYAATAGLVVLAVGTRAGSSSWGWELIGPAGVNLAALRGKRVLVPSVGGRETDFVLGGLLGGELPRGYFAAIDVAPDAVSALAAVRLGKAAAAAVPSATPVPSGLARIVRLAETPLPVLVIADAKLGADQRSRLAAAAASFSGDGVLAGFRPGGADAVRALGRRLSPPARRPPFLVPTLRVLVGDLLGDRAATIKRTSGTVFAVEALPPAE